MFSRRRDSELLTRTGAGQLMHQHGKVYGKLSKGQTDRILGYVLIPSKALAVNGAARLPDQD